MIGGGLGSEQLVTAYAPRGVVLPHHRLLLVRQAGHHRTGRRERDGQMTERERTDEQAGHDLVAHAQADRGVEHVVRQRDGRR